MDGDDDYLDARALDWSGAAVARLRQRKREAVNDAGERIFGVAIPPSALAPIVEAALNEAQRVVHAFEPELRRARRDAAVADAELAAFRRAEGITRAPLARPDPRRALARIALVLAGASACTAALLSPASAHVVSGLSPALALTAPCLALGALAGWFGLRNLERSPLSARICGVSVIVIAAAAAIGAVAWSALGLGGAHGLALAFVACGVWTFAALEARAGFDDPHPGYRRRASAAENAAARIVALHTRAQADLDSAALRARRALDRQKSHLDSAFAARRRAYDAAADVVSTCNALLRTLSDAPEPDDLAALGATIAEDDRACAQRRRARVNAAATITTALEDAAKRLES